MMPSTGIKPGSHWCWFLTKQENQTTQRKTSWSKDENQQQIQPRYDAESGNQTRTTLVLVFEETRKPDYPEKNLSEQGQELTTNSNHVQRCMMLSLGIEPRPHWCWFLRRRDNQSNQRKTSRSKDENKQQTQPTYNTTSRNQTQVTLVGGECSHHCTVPAP